MSNSVRELSPYSTLVALAPDDSWTIAQRLLFFEEPALKWLHLKRWLKRAAARRGHPIASTSSECRQLSLLLMEMFGCKIGAGPDHHRAWTCRIFSRLFACAESEKFETEAFDRWLVHADGVEAWLKLAVADSAGRELGRLSWVEFFSRFTPHWLLFTQVQSPTVRKSVGEFVNEIFELLAGYDCEDSANIDWPVLLSQFRACLRSWRANLPGNFLPDLIVLVEGTSEIILLPHLAKLLGQDLNALGAMLIPAGGANQVVRKYNQLRETVAIPIFCLLDRDAETQKEQIAAQLRRQDFLYTLKGGEIEDLIKLDSFVLLLNSYLSSPPYSALACRSIEEADFSANLTRTNILEKLWRERELGKFDKVGFAKFATEKLAEAHEISPDGRLLIKSLAALKNQGKED